MRTAMRVSPSHGRVFYNSASKPLAASVPGFVRACGVLYTPVFYCAPACSATTPTRLRPLRLMHVSPRLRARLLRATRGRLLLNTDAPPHLLDLVLSTAMHIPPTPAMTINQGGDMEW